jgi:hypothetical protein
MFTIFLDGEKVMLVPDILSSFRGRQVVHGSFG